MTPLHAAALAYAAQGVSVFPLVPGGKAPATAHSFHDATTDPAMIAAWWSAADYNIGTEPAASGQCVIDIDNKNGKDGLHAWAALCEKYGEPPGTRMVRTPNNGWHLYFIGTLPPSVGRLGDGLDVRSIGSYVVLPPSVLPEGPYIDGLLPAAALPLWLRALGEKPEREKLAAPANFRPDTPRALDAAREHIRLAVEAGRVPETGSRNITVATLAAKLHGLGVSAENAVWLIEEEFIPFGEAPDEPVWMIVKSAYRTAQNPAGSELPLSPLEKYGEAYLEKDAPERIEAGLSNATGRRPMKIEWLWPGYLARGKLHILGGGKGDGKSTLMFDLFARITSGGKWPDGTPAPLGDVLIWSGEDDIDDTILPRFMAAGGDRAHYYPIDKVLVAGVKRPFDPAHDMPVLLQAARQLPNLTAILIDPIVSAIGGDSHNNSETRRGLQPIVDLAIETRAALIGITHFTKNTQGRNPIERITGSLAFGAVPRVLLGTAKGEDETAPRRFVRIASNLGLDGGGFEYCLHQDMLRGHGEFEDMEAQRVRWGNYLVGSAKGLLGDDDASTSEGVKATAFLARMLNEDRAGGMLIREIRAAAEAHGLTWITVKRAMKKLGNVETAKWAGSRNDEWRWRFSDDPAKTPGNA